MEYVISEVFGIFRLFSEKEAETCPIENRAGGIASGAPRQQDGTIFLIVQVRNKGAWLKGIYKGFLFHKVFGISQFLLFAARPPNITPKKRPKHTEIDQFQENSISAKPPCSNFLTFRESNLLVMYYQQPKRLE